MGNNTSLLSLRIQIMTKYKVQGSGKSVDLNQGNLKAKGGEGSIYIVGDIVYKVCDEGKMIQNGNNYGVEDVPDNYDRSFSDDWLPSWKLLQASLLGEYRLKQRTIEERVVELQKRKEKLFECFVDRRLTSEELVFLLE